MRYFQTTVQRALDRACRLPTSLRPTWRWPLAFGTAAALIVSALGPSTPAVAEGPIVRDHRDPFARVQLVINRIIVHDDSDWGNGEIAINFEVISSRPGCGSPDCGTTLLRGGLPEFSATDGTVKSFDRVIPSYGDSITDDTISPPFGIPLRPDQLYWFVVTGFERDPTVDDKIGTLSAKIIDEKGQVRFGTHTERGFCGSFSAGCGGGDAKYSVEYEIRRAPVPDLRGGAIRVLDLPGSAKKLVCIGVTNHELTDAGPFEVALYVDGVVPPGGRITAGQLAGGTSGELCVEVQLPTTGQHQLKVVIDEADRVLELNETNNVYEETYTPTQPQVPAPAQPAPTPSPVPALPDLTISAVKVNGHVPDGKDDCKDGKNAVAVVVKNAGTVKADFVVRLVVDGGKIDAAVDGLDAGQEREVRFGDVRLKKGERTLVAIAGPDNTTSESNEDNNELKVTVRCGAAD